MELKELIQILAKSPDELYSTICEVVEVNDSKRVCKAQPLDGSAMLFNVRLQSIVNSQIGIVQYPSVGSHITVTFITKDLAFVSQTNEIDKILFNIGDMSVFLDAENFTQNVKNTNITGENYDVTGKKITFTAQDLFEVICQALIKVTAQNVEINAITKVTGATTINGTTTVNGTTTLNGGATITGASTMVGAVTMAAALSVAGAVSLGGGGNGGVPLSGALAQEINGIKTDINLIKTVFNNWSPVANDGGAALKAASVGWRGQQLQPTTTQQISNPNVTQ